MMKPGPFARRREAKKLDAELGNLLWRQAHDRFARSLDRYWQVVESERTSAVTQEEYNGLVNAGNALVDALATVRTICAAARQRYGEQELNVPAGADEVHRMMSRAANDLAATAQAVAMYKRGQANVLSVGRRAEKVLESVTAAKDLMKR
ncbi:hypothetical protein [Yaniella halotolerans]|uniref:hypothetical protein n=1 Tax=Yaniella halotolerans TaxID=225453 RepID=UPI0003B5CD69|nr:hypothetical protein [Yaniella halotolerans]